MFLRDSLIDTTYPELERSPGENGPASSTSVAPAPAPEQPAPTPLRPPFARPSETFWKRRTFELLALVVLVLFAWFNSAFWVPASGGYDQNGYLLPGKLLLKNGSMHLAFKNPDTGKLDPCQFAGRMWIGVDLGKPTERFYPKYPPGMSLLAAAALRIGGQRFGVLLCYAMTPAFMTLAVLATFLLARLVAGSFAALLAMIVMAASPPTLMLGNTPLSHGAAVCFVAWGMYFLLCWWWRGGFVRAVAAGLLLGYATTIRYTDGLLILPALLVVLFNLPRRWPRSLMEGAALLSWWAIPVVAMLVYNLIAMGTLTGYDPTRESTGFSWFYFLGDSNLSGNWEQFFAQMSTTGLPVLFPLALAGLALMSSWARRLAMVLAAWILPTTILYCCYYWNPDTPAGFLRFFFALFPALLMCVASLFERIQTIHFGGHRAGPRIVAPAALGLLTGLSVLLGVLSVYRAIGDAQRRNLNIARAAVEIAGNDRVRGLVPAGSVIFSSEELLHHLQFVGDWRLYHLKDSFDETTVRYLASLKNGPQLYHAPRAQMLLRKMRKNFGQPALTQNLLGIIDAALSHDRRVFLAVQGPRWSQCHLAAETAVSGAARDNPMVDRDAVRQQSLAAQAVGIAAANLAGTKAEQIQPLYDVHILTAWDDPCQEPPIEVGWAMEGRAFFQRPRSNLLAENPAPWLLLELTKRPPATQAGK